MSVILKKAKFLVINLFQTNLNKISRKIEDYDVVCFDIYDTLIKRNISEPADVFDLVEQKYNQISKHKITEFKKRRILAESEARKSCLDEEVTLDYIYDNLESIDINVKTKLKKLEIEIEKKISARNDEMYSIYKKCIDMNKKVFAISDMYLPLNVIESILISLGYDQFDKIYLSSNDKKTKKSGQIYEKIILENNFEHKKVVHIGDSLYNDFYMAKKHHFDSFLIDRQNIKTMFCKKKKSDNEYSILTSFINNCLPNGMSYYEKFGYEILGPILYSYTSWIHNLIITNDIDKVYFLARDAKIVMDIYNLKYQDTLPVFYLNVSRKSIINASVTDVNNFDEIMEKFKTLIKPTFKLNYLFSILNLDLDKFKALLIEKKIDINKLIVDMNTLEKEAVYKIIKSQFTEKNKLQNKYIKKFLNQHDFNDNVALVDIGWKGTMQDYLESFNLNNVKIFGFYYGLKNSQSNQNISKHGCLFDNYKNENMLSILMSLGLFEMMFLSIEGSTVEYTEDNKIIVPVFDKSEISIKNVQKILSIQKMARQFAIDVLNSNSRDIIDKLSPSTCFENYKNFIKNFSLKDIHMLGTIEFKNTTEAKLVEHQSLFKYFFHPKQLYIDFKNSSCKIMFLKDVFKIKLPYYKMLLKLYDNLEENDTNESIIKIIVATHKQYQMPTDLIYLPVQVGAKNGEKLQYQRDDEGENISEKNPYFCELTGLFWAWKNLKCDYVGLCHYRRYFTLNKKKYVSEQEKFRHVLSLEETKKLMKSTDIILPKKRNYYIENLYDHYKHTLYIEPLEITREIISIKYPRYLKEFDNLKKRKSAHMFNMFIMKKNVLDAYCNWLFDILFELENRIDYNIYDSFHARFFGRISELLLDVFIYTNQLTYKEVKVINMQKVNWVKKGISFLKAKFLGAKYDKSF